MAATIGIDYTSFDISEPTVGHTQEADIDSSVDLATVRDDQGITVLAFPKKMITETQTLRGKGDAQLSAVTAGSFVEGTAKIISAKNTENAEDLPDFEIEAKKYDSI